MDSVAASTPHDKEVEEQRQRGHGQDDESSLRQDGAAVHVDDRRRGREGCEQVTHIGESTHLIFHVVHSRLNQRAERVGQEIMRTL